MHNLGVIFAEWSIERAGDVLVRMSGVQRAFAIARSEDKHWAKINPGKVQPQLQSVYRAGMFRRPTANLYVSPAGFGIESEAHAVLENLNPTTAVQRVVFADIQAGNVRPAQPANVPNERI